MIKILSIEKIRNSKLEIRNLLVLATSFFVFFGFSLDNVYAQTCNANIGVVFAPGSCGAPSEAFPIDVWYNQAPPATPTDTCDARRFVGSSCVAVGPSTALNAVKSHIRTKINSLTFEPASNRYKLILGAWKNSNLGFDLLSKSVEVQVRVWVNKSADTTGGACNNVGSDVKNYSWTIPADSVFASATTYIDGITESGCIGVDTDLWAYTVDGYTKSCAGGSGLGAQTNMQAIIATHACASQTGSIGGRKYEDISGDGWYQGELETDRRPLSDWAVTITGPNGYSNSATTDVSGIYIFSNLNPGEYVVQEVYKDNWVQSHPQINGDPVEHRYTLSSGETKTDLDFYNYQIPQTGSISGYKYHDINADGQYQNGEPGLGGWEVILLDTSGNRIKSALTSTTGYYILDDVFYGSYTLEEFSPQGEPNWVGSNPPEDSVTGRVAQTVTLSAQNPNSANINFLNYKKGSISGHKYEDISGDGWYQGELETDRRLVAEQSFRVVLYKEGVSGDFAETYTANGVYTFNDLLPGSYMVVEYTSQDWFQTHPKGPQRDDYKHSVSLSSGENKTDLDFYNVKIRTGLSLEKRVSIGAKSSTECEVGWNSSPPTFKTNAQVAPNTQVTYCYKLTNTGNVNLKSFSLTDDFGSVGNYSNVAGCEYNEELTPQGSIYCVSESKLIPSTTVDITNLAFAQANDPFSNKVYSNNDEAVVSVEHPPVCLSVISSPQDTIILGEGPVTLTLSGQDKDGDPILFEIDWGDVPLKETVEQKENQTSVSSKPHYYSKEGQYTIQARAYNSGGEDSCDTLILTVEVKKGSISGYKYNDLNGNGVYDQGELAMSNWAINLYRIGETNPFKTQTTKQDGMFTFTDVPYGQYLVSEVLQEGWFATNPTDSQGNPTSFSVTLDAPVLTVPLLFLNNHYGSISGYKYHDLNGDGIHQNNEPPLSGFTIWLDLDKNGDYLPLYNSGDLWKVTGPDGKYEFNNIPFGKYYISEFKPNGGVYWIKTSPVNQPDFPHEYYYELEITPQNPNTALDFLNYEGLALYGRKFEDLSGDGWYQGEPQTDRRWLKDEVFKVRLTNLDTGETRETEIVDGAYKFEENLRLGRYKIEEILETGRDWMVTYPLNGYHEINFTKGGVYGEIDFYNARSGVECSNVEVTAQEGTTYSKKGYYNLLALGTSVGFPITEAKFVIDVPEKHQESPSIEILCGGANGDPKCSITPTSDLRNVQIKYEGFLIFISGEYKFNAYVKDQNGEFVSK